MSLTVAAVEAQLRRLLQSPRVSLHFHALEGKLAGKVFLYSKRILVNPFNGCITDTVVHELIHMAFDRKLTKWGQLEEDLVLAIEDRVVRHINRSERRRTAWHRLIQEKLPDA